MDAGATLPSILPEKLRAVWPKMRQAVALVDRRRRNEKSESEEQRKKRAQSAEEMAKSPTATLIAEPNFVVAHSKYLGIEAFVKGLEPHRHARVLQSWQDLVESKLHKIIDVPYLGMLPLRHIRLMPKKQPLLGHESQKDAQNGQGQSWLIGYDVDRERLQGNMLDLTATVDAFRDECMRTASWQEMEGMDEEEVWWHLKIKFIPFGSCKELPDAVLAPVWP